MLTISLLVFVISISFSSCQTQVKILEGEALYIEPDADDVVVTCNIENLGQKTVKWTIDDRDIFIITRDGQAINMDTFDEDKYVVTSPDVPGGNYTFTVNDVTKDFNATIGCEAGNAPPARIFISVREKLNEVVKSYKSKEWSVKQSKGRTYIHVPQYPINLTCTAPQVRPAPKVYWSWRNFRKSNSQSQIISVDDSMAETHDNQIHNFSSTLNVNINMVRNLIQSKDTDMQTTTTIPFLLTTTAQAETTTRTNLSSPELPEDPTSLQLAENDKFNAEIEVTCLVDQLGKTIKKSFNLHIGRSAGSTIFTKSSLTVSLLFAVALHFINIFLCFLSESFV